MSPLLRTLRDCEHEDMKMDMMDMRDKEIHGHNNADKVFCIDQATTRGKLSQGGHGSWNVWWCVNIARTHASCYPRSLYLILIDFGEKGCRRRLEPADTSNDER